MPDAGPVSPPLSGRPFIEAEFERVAYRARRSPPLSGRPFIEAASARGVAVRPGRSPPLSGRPFIEAWDYDAQ